MNAARLVTATESGKTVRPNIKNCDNINFLVGCTIDKRTFMLLTYHLNVLLKNNKNHLKLFYQILKQFSLPIPYF